MRCSPAIKLYRDIDAAAGKPCPYCGTPMHREDCAHFPSRDHIKPRAAGATLQKNKLICCQKCNEDKAALTIWAWHGALSRAGDARAGRVLNVIVKLYRHLGHEAYGRVVGRQSDGAWFP